jgi:hypothetical protein
MIRVEVCDGDKRYGARTKQGLLGAMRRCATTPIVRGNATSLIAMGAFVVVNGDPMRPVIEWEPGKLVRCEVIP